MTIVTLRDGRPSSRTGCGVLRGERRAADRHWGRLPCPPFPSPPVPARRAAGRPLRDGPRGPGATWPLGGRGRHEAEPFPQRREPRPPPEPFPTTLPDDWRPARLATPEGNLQPPSSSARPPPPRGRARRTKPSPAAPHEQRSAGPRGRKREGGGGGKGSRCAPRTHVPGSAPRGAPGPARGTSAPVAAFEQRAKWSAPRRFRVGPGRAAAAGAGQQEGRAGRRRRRKEAAAFVGLARSWRRRGGPGASPPLAHGAAPLAGGRGAERGRGAARGGHVPRGGARARGGGGVTPRGGNGGAGRRAAPGAAPGFGSRTRPGEKQRNHGGGGERGIVSSEPFKRAQLRAP